MSIYGDLSKPQRALLQDLFHGTSPDRGKSRLGTDQVKRAVSIAKPALSAKTALQVDAKSRQTARNLAKHGFVQTDGMWRPRIWLTPAGLELMRSLDYRHARVRRKLPA